MAAVYYTEFRDMADQMLADFGQAAAIRRRAATTGDPWNPTVPATPYVDHLCTVAVIDYDQRERDGSMIQQNDRRCLIAAGGLSIVPDAGDQLVLSSATYSIVACNPVSPAGVDVVYDAQVRR